MPTGLAADPCVPMVDTVLLPYATEGKKRTGDFMFSNQIIFLTIGDANTDHAGGQWLLLEQIGGIGGAAGTSIGALIRADTDHTGPTFRTTILMTSSSSSDCPNNSGNGKELWLRMKFPLIQETQGKEFRQRTSHPFLQDSAKGVLAVDKVFLYRITQGVELDWIKYSCKGDLGKSNRRGESNPQPYNRC